MSLCSGFNSNLALKRNNTQAITRVLTHALFTVSAWHEVLGNANEYTDFRGADTRIYSFAQMKSKVPRLEGESRGQYKKRIHAAIRTAKKSEKPGERKGV